MDGTFIKSKTTELPRIIMVGHEVINEVGNVCKKLHLENPALMVSDKTTKEIAGLLCFSSRRIETHRESIREKIGTKKKKANFRTHLLSIK